MQVIQVLAVDEEVEHVVALAADLRLCTRRGRGPNGPKKLPTTSSDGHESHERNRTPRYVRLVHVVVLDFDWSSHDEFAVALVVHVVA